MSRAVAKVTFVFGLLAADQAKVIGNFLIGVKARAQYTVLRQA